jgi:hypothetical protein
MQKHHAAEALSHSSYASSAGIYRLQTYQGPPPETYIPMQLLEFSCTVEAI